MAKIERTEKEMNGRWTISENETEMGKMQYRWLNKSKFDIFTQKLKKNLQEKVMAENYWKLR